MKPKIRILLTLLFSSLAISLLFFALSSHPSLAKSDGTPSDTDEVDWRKLHPNLVRLVAQPQQEELISVIVEWRRDETSLRSMAEQFYESKQDHREKVVQVLQEQTALQTAGLVKILETAKRRGQASEVRLFWVSPVISLKASPDLIKSLSTRSEITFIRMR
jgi:hypothetical protein